MAMSKNINNLDDIGASSFSWVDHIKMISTKLDKTMKTDSNCFITVSRKSAKKLLKDKKIYLKSKTFGNRHYKKINLENVLNFIVFGQRANRFKQGIEITLSFVYEYDVKDSSIIDIALVTILDNNLEEVVK